LINVDSTIHDLEVVTAARAAKLLGVKRETLYAYVSRGMLRRVLPVGKRVSGYVLADVMRLRARANARKGHAAVASGALRWGEPVLETAIAGIGARGPLYRGRWAVDLANEGVSFERVAELLWTGELPSATPRWTPSPPPSKAKALAALTARASIPVRLQVLVAALAAEHSPIFGASELLERDRARALVARMASLLGDAHGPSVAATFARALGLRETAASAVDVALVLVADHELNASSFAARIAAGAGCDLHACINAALATASGSNHGGECDRVEALMLQGRAARLVRERAARGERISGFGHTLYPKGDPRATPLLALARSISKRSAAPFDEVADTMQGELGFAPTIDFGLVALTAALGAPPGSAVGLFVLGRSAGWVAHVQEQRRADFLLRPRARYIGPSPIADP